MIKFAKGGLDQKLLLGFGLSRANMEQLMNGNPISADISELGLRNVEIYIFFGETEEQMAADLRQFISEKTLFIDRKRGVEN